MIPQIDRLNSAQSAAIINALRALDADAANLRRMRKELGNVPQNFSTFDRAETAGQARRDETEIAKYKRAVRAYRRKVARLERQFA